MPDLHKKLKERFPDKVIEIHNHRGDETAVIEGSALQEVARFLKTDPEFDLNILMDLSAVDGLEIIPSPAVLPQSGNLGLRRGASGATAGDGMKWRPPATDSSAGRSPAHQWRPRFEVVYHFYSLAKNHRLRVKVRVDEKDAVPTLTSLWPIANWFEREVWDMFGLRFEGHPDLKRILLYDEFVGHPLRKDYPCSKRQPLIGPVK